MTRPGFGAHVKKLQQQKRLALSQIICRENSNTIFAIVYCKRHRYANLQVSSQVKIAGRAGRDDSLMVSAYTMLEDLYGSAILSSKAVVHCSLSSPALCMTGLL